MPIRRFLCAIAVLAMGAAEAAKTEYECDDGNSGGGYRIRVVELNRDVREIIVLKKSNGSARVVENGKLRRAGGSPSNPRFAGGKPGRALSFRSSAADADGNWTGTFTLPEKRGPLTVQAACGRVETLSL